MTQKELFKQVWDERPHRSEVSGFTIREPRAMNFAHIVSKGKYPHLKFRADNICLMTAEEHHLWDNNRGKCTGSEWDWVKQREHELISMYWQT